MLRIVAGAALAALLVPAAARAADGAAPGGKRTAAPGDYRLHAALPATPRTPVVDGPEGRLRTGFGGSMVGLYPLRNSGFHLSAGGRLFGRPGAPRTGEPETDRLLAMPRGTGLGGRGGRRRPSPAMLVGVDRTVGQGLALGIDGGAALGRLYSSPGRLGRLLSGHRGGGGAPGRLNEIGRVTMLYRF